MCKLSELHIPRVFIEIELAEQMPLVQDMAWYVDVHEQLICIAQSIGIHLSDNAWEHHIIDQIHYVFKHRKPWLSRCWFGDLPPGPELKAKWLNFKLNESQGLEFELISLLRICKVRIADQFVFVLI